MPIYDFYKSLQKYVVDRICFECDHRYKGLLYCHKCGQPSGEPITPDQELKPTVQRGKP